MISVREDPVKGVFVNVCESQVGDFESPLKCFFLGEKNRLEANHCFTESRTIFTIAVKSLKKVKHDTENVDNSVFFLTLNLVNLSGPDNGKNN